METYLQLRFYKDNIKKYHKYFKEWFSNLTKNQLYYFEIDFKRNKL